MPVRRHGGEPVLAAGPVAAHRLDAGAAYHRAQHHRRDDRVVGVPDHRGEVRDQVDRDGQKGQQPRFTSRRWWA
jgi:hypothetical protein